MMQARYRLELTAIAGLAGLLTACGDVGPAATAEQASGAHKENAGEPLRGANILVYSRTAGWRHDSIPAGVAMFDALSAQYGFKVVATEDPTVFSDEQIGSYDAVVFLNTTGDVLNEPQQQVFERYIQSGGGFVGIHAASDTEHDGAWPWYIGLVGGTFASHPSDPSNVQQAQLSRAEGAGALSSGLPETFAYVDEWYDFNNFDPATRPILIIDRDSYQGAAASGEERIAWFHDYDDGRAFYTNLGHTKETFENELFRRHLLNGLVYAIGDRRRTELSD